LILSLYSNDFVTCGTSHIECCKSSRIIYWIILNISCCSTKRTRGIRSSLFLFS